MYNTEDGLFASNVLKLKFNKYTIEDFLEGINIESEHGLVNPDTNITDDDIIKTAKIALAHLNEYKNYYNKEYGIKAFEQSLKSKER